MGTAFLRTGSFLEERWGRGGQLSAFVQSFPPCAETWLLRVQKGWRWLGIHTLGLSAGKSKEDKEQVLGT